MSVVNYISCKKIIADFYRDVRPLNSNWAYDAIEWINFALGELGSGFNVELVSKELEVTNHRAKLPCDRKGIRMVEYCGRVLPQLTAANVEDHGDLNTKPYYNIANPSYLRTSFLKGTIKIYYYKIATDENGDILIPDDGAMRIRIYLQEYILMKYLARGGQHPVRSYNEVHEKIYTKYGDGSGLLERAKATASFPSPSNMEMLKNSLVTPMKDWYKSERQWFYTNGKGEIDFHEDSTSTYGHTISDEIIVANEGYESPDNECDQ